MKSAACSVRFSLAWRNLWRQKRRTWLNAAAIALTTAILIFLPALQLGSYQAMVTASVQLLDGEAQIQRKYYLDTPAMRESFVWEQLTDDHWRENFPALSLAPRAIGFGLLSKADKSFGAQLIGVDPLLERSFSKIANRIVAGRYLSPSASKTRSGDAVSEDNSLANSDEIILGDSLASNLAIKPGDKVILLGSGRDGSLAVDALTVVGIFRSGFKELDRQLGFMPLKRFQQTFSMDGHIHSLVIVPTRPDWLASRKAEFAQSASQVLREKFTQQQLVIRDWRELQPALISAIKIDMSSALAMYLILIAVVVFSLMNTVLMSVMERTREFGMMMALGTRSGLLAQIVWLESIMIAIIGITIGMMLGILVTLYYQNAGISFEGAEAMLEQFGLHSRIYPKLNWLSLLPGPLVILLFLIVAAFYPVSRIFKLEIIPAMRAA